MLAGFRKIESENLINTDKIDEIKKSGFILSEFDFKGFLASLTQVELLAFGGLLLNTLILNYTLNIILILYGEYLINRFDLENKYPKLAKFIQIRRKLQSYYLKACFVWIFIGLTPQLYIYIFILSSKIIEIFNY